MAKREPRDMVEVVSRAAYPELWRMIDKYWDDDDWNGMAAQQAVQTARRDAETFIGRLKDASHEIIER